MRGYCKLVPVRVWLVEWAGLHYHDQVHIPIAVASSLANQLT